MCIKFSSRCSNSFLNSFIPNIISIFSLGLNSFKLITLYLSNPSVNVLLGIINFILVISILESSKTFSICSIIVFIRIIEKSSSRNPHIKDATDREKLVDTIEYLEFTTIIKAAVKLLEGLRKSDRIETDNHSVEGSRTLTDLLSSVDSQELLSEVEEKVKSGATVEDLVQIVKDYSSDTQEKIEDLKDRLVYYGQVASVGSISGFIIHEIRGRMTSVKRYLDYTEKEYSPFNQRMQKSYDYASLAHQRMIDVSNTFAPIFDAGLRQRKNYC